MSDGGRGRGRNGVSASDGAGVGLDVTTFDAKEFAVEAAFGLPEAAAGAAQSGRRGSGVVEGCGE